MTPRQVQRMLEPMRIRLHNERATAYKLHGFDLKGTEADFIDPETEQMLKDISRQHYIQEMAERGIKEMAVKNG